MASTLTTTAAFAVTTGATREDLKDMITQIAIEDTPLMSNIGKEDCNNTTPNWLTETLAAAATNTQVEGEDVGSSYSASAGPTRLSNICSISRKLVEISGSLEASTVAGMKSVVKSRLTKAMKELSRDMEYNLINNVYSAGSPRVLRGLVDWQNDVTYVDTTQYYDFGGAYAATNDLTEDLFNDMMQYARTQGGKPDMVLAAPTQKRIISGFNGSNKITVNADSTAKKITNVVDIYEGDFGLVKVYTEWFFADDTDSGAYYDKVSFIEKDKWAVGFLRPLKTEKMAKVGDSDRTMILSEYTLFAKAPKSSALLAKLARA